MIQNVLTPNSPKNSSSRGGGGAGRQREIWTKEATELEREKQDGYNWLSDVSSPLSMWVRRGWNMLRDAPPKTNNRPSTLSEAIMARPDRNWLQSRTRTGSRLSPPSKTLLTQSLPAAIFISFSIYQPPAHLPFFSKISHRGQPDIIYTSAGPGAHSEGVKEDRRKTWKHLQCFFYCKHPWWMFHQKKKKKEKKH